MRVIARHGRALWWVVAARLSLRRRRATETLQRFAAARPARPARGAAVDRASTPKEMLFAVRRVGRLTHTPCLPQAIALASLCHRRGLDPTVVLGCRRYDNGEWGAHAWVRIGQRDAAAVEVLDPIPSGAHLELAWCRAEDNWRPVSPPAVGA